MRMPARLAALAFLALPMAGCENINTTPWPPTGAGGLAERRQSQDLRIDQLQQRLFRLAERNARYYAAAEFQNAEFTMVRVRRLSEGGFPEDAEIQIAILKSQMNKIERILNSSSGKGS